MERKTNEENYYCNWKMKQENKGERKNIEVKMKQQEKGKHENREKERKKMRKMVMSGKFYL